MSYGEALKAADLELYAAKAAGRNCCVADRTVYRARAARRDRGAARGAPIRLIALRAGAGDDLGLDLAAPSKIDRMRASQSRRLTGYSRAKPLPPWIWRALSAAAQATRAASSFAMPASRSQRLPSSFWCAAK